MKNVLLLGATGTAGCAITKELLSEADCHLTLFARHAREMYTAADRVSVIDGDADDFVLTMKGEAAKGYTTPIPALVKLAVQLIEDDTLYSRESISITQDATKTIS